MHFTRVFGTFKHNADIFEAAWAMYKKIALVIIGPESDHWECLSVTHWLTHCRLINLIDVTLAYEDGNSKLVEVVTVVEVDDEKCVDNSLVQLEGELWS